MVLERAGSPLVSLERPDPAPGPNELRVKVEACAVCRTDLHVVDGDLSDPRLPLVPGHQIVGIVDQVGPGVEDSRIGRRVGIPWLGQTYGDCGYCRSNAENLCDRPQFTGYMSLPMTVSLSTSTRWQILWLLHPCSALA
jgi:alcohol dehydrogenase, propanol-preferring